LSNSIQHQQFVARDGYSDEIKSFVTRHLSRSAKEIAHRTGIPERTPIIRHIRREFRDSHQL